MDSRNTPMGDAGDWSDMSMFNTSQFDDSMPAESPYNSAFTDFTNFDAYGDSPIGLSLRTPSKSGPESAATAGAQNPQHAPIINSTSAESSSQDSASDTSSRRKRKTNESESPISDPQTDTTKREPKLKQEEGSLMNADRHQLRAFDNTYVQPMQGMHNLSLEQTMSADTNMTQFDFNSAASSPIQTGDFNTAMSLDAQVNMPASSMAAQFNQDSPVQTINPGMFTLGGSRDQSPATNNMMFNQPSPNAIFSTPSSDSQDFANVQTWNPALAQNPAWPGDFTNQLTSPGGIAFTPSPVANGATPAASGRSPTNRLGRSPLHIAPISTKSRVETQINVVMTLEKPPPGTEHLHLPLHTIAKSKLLAKDEYEKSKVLELHTMLVCTSAMHNPQLKEKALQKAAGAKNDEIQRRAELARDSGDDEKNDPKNVDEADKPANGGEVRICSNCIQRERKRAGRKKTKREEEQQHWERFETERVVVFNSNEYLPFKPCEAGQQLPVREGAEPEQYNPPDGALQVTAAMRIACYCRHQSEKEGFQVIFTLKDQQGSVIAQQISDSILITDDHKTHPQSFSTAVTAEGFYQSANPTYMPNGLPMSHSMVDMTTHAQPFTSSRSAGNLQALAYNAQYNPHSHVHQLPGSGYASQTTSATMTPTSLSRPGSPTTAGQAGPNKKRKSSTFHRKVPSGLTMTPRVDTSQPPSSNMPSAMSMNSQFSPTGTVFPGQVNPSYMTIPNNNGPAQYFGSSGPPTPNESGPFNFGQQQVDMSRMANNQAYFSHPSSAVPSRSSSPVLQQTRANMAAYARQQPIQTPTNTINARPAMFAGQVPPNTMDGSPAPYPVITRITPMEGPVSGGTEVAILGENFVMGITVSFGDQVATTQFLSSTSLLAIAPPGRPGSVHLNLTAPHNQGRFPDPSSKPIFRYTQNSEEMMIMALKYISEQQYGNVDTWQSLAQQSATNFVQSRVSRAGLQQQGYPSSHRTVAESTDMEETMLRIFDAVDMPGSDMISASGASMLALACSMGMRRVVAALLARGANADVRDGSGYTPLMHAALHGRTKIFQLLVARGADPTIRTLSGYTAMELAPTETRDELTHILASTQRRRHSRPSLQTRISYGSAASSKASWDIASASFYESEFDGSDQPVPSEAHSRRSSTQILPACEEAKDSDEAPTLSRCAAMQAWRDMLAAQIQHFQESVQQNMSNIHLPPLPSLAGYRGFSSLMPRTAPSPVNSAALQQPPLARHPQPQCQPPGDDDADASAPPAYHDIFPDRKPTCEERALQDSAVRTAVVDAVADEKCGMMFEQRQCSDTRSNPAAWRPNKAEKGLVPPWLWVSANHQQVGVF